MTREKRKLALAVAKSLVSDNVLNILVQPYVVHENS